MAFEFWSKIFFMNAVWDKNQFNFNELKWFVNKLPPKQDYLPLKAKKANYLVENPSFC